MCVVKNTTQHTPRDRERQRLIWFKEFFQLFDRLTSPQTPRHCGNALPAGAQHTGGSMAALSARGLMDVPSAAPAAPALAWVPQ